MTLGFVAFRSRYFLNFFGSFRFMVGNTKFPWLSKLDSGQPLDRNLYIHLAPKIDSGCPLLSLNTHAFNPEGEQEWRAKSKILGIRYFYWPEFTKSKIFN